MEVLHRRAPNNATILEQLARFCGLRYDYEAAERYFEQSIRLVPHKTKALVSAGKACLAFNHYALAEAYFQRALDRPDATAEMCIQLAELYVQGRRLEEAQQLVERAFQKSPACPAALFASARLNRLVGKLDLAESQLRVFPVNTEPELRARAAYEFGMVLDRQNQYDNAMAAFLDAKNILCSHTSELTSNAKNLKILRDQGEKLQRQLMPETLGRWFETRPANPCRLALLGGHPRSGTTLLEQVLDAHPDVVTAEELEIFTDDAYATLTLRLPGCEEMLPVLETSPPDALQTARENYFRAMELALGQPIGHRMLIDKNPSLTTMSPALIRIFPEIKFLVMLRDPRDVVLSCFMQAFVPTNMVSTAYLSLENATVEYTEVMGMWRTVSSLMRNPYLEVRYEHMVDNLETVARRTLDFIGVPWSKRVLDFDEHARSKVVRSPTYNDVTQPVYKRAVGRWRHYQKYLEPILPRLEPFVKAFGYE